MVGPTPPAGDERQLCALADQASGWPWLGGSAGAVATGGRSSSTVTPPATTTRTATAMPGGTHFSHRGAERSAVDPMSATTRTVDGHGPR